MASKTRGSFRLAVAQFDAVSGDLGHNIAWHVDLIEQAADEKADLIVFPELSVTGYCASLLDRDVDTCAIDPQGEKLSDLRGACARRAIAAVVGAPVQGENGVHLSAIVIGRDGAIERVYDKMYVDRDERQWFVRGTCLQQITLDGWNLGLGICYDSSFPEHARRYALEGADAYLVPGAFPLGRSDFRRTIYFPARALENTLYLAFANFVGAHDGVAYGGMSAIYGPDGQRLADAGTSNAGIAVLDLDRRHLTETRKSLQMLEDCR